MKVGQTREIVLITGGGVPYVWDCSISPSKGIDTTSHYYVIDQTPGGKVEHVFYFLAKISGVYTIHMKYARNSESTSPREEITFTITVTE